MRRNSGAFQELARAVAHTYTPTRAIVVGICALAGFVLVVNSSWIATPDSALYLELGESLAQGNGYLFNGEPHTYVPPGFPYLVSLVAGARNGFLPYRALMALLGAGTALAGALLVWRLYGRDLGLMVGGVCALNHVLLENSTLTTSDVPFALVVCVGLHAVVSAGAKDPRSRCLVLVAGGLMGLAPLFRVNGWGVLPAAAWYMFCKDRDVGRTVRFMWVGVFLAVAMTPGTAWHVWSTSQPPSLTEGTYVQAVTGRSLGDQVTVMAHSLWNYVPETTYLLTGVAVKDALLEFVVPALILIGWVTAVRRKETLWVPLIAIQYGGLLLSSAGSRYLLVMLPGLYLLFALGLLEFFTWITRRLHEPRDTRSTAGKFLVATFIVLGVLNVGHNVKTVLQCRYPVEFQGAERLRDVPFFEASRWLKEHAPHALVMTMHPRVLHYLSGCPTVELIRSGVPEREAWVNSPPMVARLVNEYRPEYLFSDGKLEPFFAAVMAGVREAGSSVEEIPLQRSGERFRLWRLVHDPGKR